MLLTELMFLNSYIESTLALFFSLRKQICHELKTKNLLQKMVLENVVSVESLQTTDLNFLASTSLLSKKFSTLDKSIPNQNMLVILYKNEDKAIFASTELNESCTNQTLNKNSSINAA